MDVDLLLRFVQLRPASTAPDEPIAFGVFNDSLRLNAGRDRDGSIQPNHFPASAACVCPIEMMWRLSLFGVRRWLFRPLQGWLPGRNWHFPAVNPLGAVLVMASIIDALNRPSVVLECFWGAISVDGLVRSLRRQGRVNDLFINCRLNEKAGGECPRRLNIWR